MDNKFANNAPQVIEMEKFLLSSMLLKKGEVIPAVAAILDADDFYRPEHRIIYQTILNIDKKKLIPSILTLCDDLRKTTEHNGKSLLDNIGIEYVLALTEAAHTTAYSVQYAQNIKEKAIQRKLITIGENLIHDATIGLKSPLDIIADLQKDLDIKDTSNEKFFNVGNYVVTEFLQRAELQKQFADRKSNFFKLDNFQHWKPGLYILGATPACGKTTFAWQLLEQFAENDENCIFCSYEMDTQSLIAKTIARRLFQYYDTETTSMQLQFGNTPPSFSDMAAMLFNKNLNFSVRKFTDENVDKLLAVLRQQLKEFDNFDKPPIICIDYIQRLIPRDHKSADTRALIDDALYKLKDFSTETNATIFGISTFNRANYNSTPSFETFKESGGVEYTADVVWALQLNIANKLYGEKENVIRQKINAAKLEQPREINLKCLKNRFGNNYDCYFQYFSAHDYFKECDEFDFISSKTNANSESANDSDNEINL